MYVLYVCVYVWVRLKRMHACVRVTMCVRMYGRASPSPFALCLWLIRLHCDLSPDHACRVAARGLPARCALSSICTCACSTGLLDEKTKTNVFCASTHEATIALVPMCKLIHAYACVYIYTYTYVHTWSKAS